MGKKKRGNYNQDHFKVGGSMQPGGDVVQEREKRRLAEKESSAASRQPIDQTPGPKRQPQTPNNQGPDG
jgi:hypothetical protein